MRLCQRRRWPLRAGCCGTVLHAGALAALALLRARPTQLQLRAGHRRSSTSRSSGLSLFIARSLQPPARPPWWPNSRQGSGCDSPWRHGGVTTSSEGSPRRRAHLTGSTAARGAEPSPRAHPLPREHHRPARLPTRPHPACRDPPRALLARGQAAPGGTTSRRSFSHRGERPVPGPLASAPPAPLHTLTRARRAAAAPVAASAAAFTLRFVWCAPRDLFAPRRMEEHPPLTRRSKDPRRRPLRHTHSPPLSHDQRWLASRAQAS